LAKDPGSKACPLLFLVSLEDKDQCLKTECMLYVKVKKELPCHEFERIMTYEGCGLVHVIPWNIVKRPDFPDPKGHLATLEASEKDE